MAQSSTALQQQASSSLSSSITSSPYAPSSHHLEHSLLTAPPASASGSGMNTLDSSIYSLTPDLPSLPNPDIDSTGAPQVSRILYMCVCVCVCVCVCNWMHTCICELLLLFFVFYRKLHYSLGHMLPILALLRSVSNRSSSLCVCVCVSM